jgi:AcrR family transcriptional regulator
MATGVKRMVMERARYSSPKPAADDGMTVRVDGRRVRSRASRARIVGALMQLVDQGEVTPTAEMVAEQAGVSLRTVFRHFDEMENLFLEIADTILRRAQDYIGLPFATERWPDLLPELVDRRAEFYEAVSRFKSALDYHRRRSPALAEAHAQVAELSRNVLLSRIPPESMPEPARLEALVLLVSIETWQRLRLTQRLSVTEAKAVVLEAMRALLR